MDKTNIPQIELTEQQMKEQASVILNIINEIRPILQKEDEDDSMKLVRVCNLIALMYGTADYTLKKMEELKMDKITTQDILTFGEEYMEFFKKANADKIIQPEESEEKSEA